VLLNASHVSLTLLSEKGQILSPPKSVKNYQTVAPAQKRAKNIETVLEKKFGQTKYSHSKT
jgi:hypothetical protein